MWCFGGFLECQLHCKSFSCWSCQLTETQPALQHYSVSEEFQCVSWGCVSGIRETVEKLSEKGTPRKCRGDCSCHSGVPVLNSVPVLSFTSAGHLWLCCLASFILSAITEAAELLLPVKSLQPRAHKAFSPGWEQCPCPSCLATAVAAPGSKGFFFTRMQRL